ncbi:MAG: hypothetical protein AB7G37_00490 [Solirubrobacteraceae bacterium]
MSTSARSRLPTYERLLAIAARGPWDPHAVDLSVDRDRIDAVAAGDRERLRGLVAGFVVAEDAVAEHLASFAPVAGDRGRAACLRAQGRDEDVHAAATRRLWAAVGDDRDPADLVPDAFRVLFRERLPAVAAAVGHGLPLADAVGLYHGLLEGVVFLAGQDALLDLADAHDLPGTAGIIRRIQKDERWHVSLGMRALCDLPDEERVASALHQQAPSAVAAWGHLVPQATGDAVLHALERRLRILGMGPFAGADQAPPIM